MRIKIEPTDDQSSLSEEFKQHAVIIEHPDDGLSLDVVMELIEHALAGFGYHHHSIDVALHGEPGKGEKP